MILERQRYPQSMHPKIIILKAIAPESVNRGTSDGFDHNPGIQFRQHRVFNLQNGLKKYRQPVTGPVCRQSGRGGQQSAAWRYGIPISRMDGKNQNDHSGWMLKPLAVS